MKGLFCNLTCVLLLSLPLFLFFYLQQTPAPCKINPFIKSVLKTPIATPPTTTVVPPTLAPDRLLYKTTTDYLWSNFDKNATRIVGPWSGQKGEGISDGPFGMGNSVVLKRETCMAHRQWVDKGDGCSAHLKDCKDGYSFSLWEKNSYDTNTMVNYGLIKFQQKYIVSSGVEYDLDKGTACPGFAIYRQGADLHAVVSTGTKVWNVTVVGMITDLEWINIGVRWKYSDVNSTTKANKDDVGIEIYINKVMVARSSLPAKQRDGTFDFTERSDCSVDGDPPPVVTLGCAYNRSTGQFDRFGDGEYDELAVWNRQLIINGSVDEREFFFGGYSTSFGSVGADAFQLMMKQVDLESNKQSELAQNVLSAMLLGPPTTTPAIPTRTDDPNAEKTSTEVPNGATTSATTTTAKPDAEQLKKMADDQLQLQDAVSAMLVQTHAIGSCESPDVQNRLAMAGVAGKLLDGSDEANVAKWKSVEKVYPEEEGAPKTFRQLEWYMLDYIGCVNISGETGDTYFSPQKKSMNYYTSGDGFVMNGDKYFPEDFRAQPRLHYPNYKGPEWVNNLDTWDTPIDTYSVPTGMFKDQPGCNDKPVTVVATILNQYGKVVPKRRNPSLILAKNWTVDSKVVSFRVDVNPETMEYNYKEVEPCLPDPHYLKWNPIKATLYHFDPTQARIERRVARSLLWHSEKNLGEGVEVRQCAWWNERLGTNGAWDPSACTTVSTDANKTSCECSELGSVAVVSELSERFLIPQATECKSSKIIKYIGIAVSVVACLIFILGVFTKKTIWDMFHSLRMHLMACWIGLVSMHIVTDFDSVRQDYHVNLYCGTVQAYFYVATTTWTACEAHGTFRAFTQGIISGRERVYYPFGYGTPLAILGVMYTFFELELGTDPRCFVSSERMAKTLFFIYLVLVALIGLVFGVIVMCNVAKPQTRRLNLVKHLKSQAYGTIGSTVIMFVFSLFSAYVYIRHPESEWWDIYCPFSLGLGYLGLALFAVLGVLSIRFRNGMLGKKDSKEKYLVKDEETEATVTEAEADTDEPQDDTQSVVTSAVEEDEGEEGEDEDDEDGDEVEDEEVEQEEDEDEEESGDDE